MSANTQQRSRWETFVGQYSAQFGHGCDVLAQTIDPLDTSGLASRFGVNEQTLGWLGEWLLARAQLFNEPFYGGQTADAVGCSLERQPTGQQYGPPGWLRICQIERLLMGNLEPYQAGYARFYGVHSEQARLLLKLVPRLALAARHNRSPQLWELLSVAAAHPGQVYVEGYAISSQFSDERISCDLLFIAEPGHEPPPCIDSPCTDSPCTNSSCTDSPDLVEQLYPPRWVACRPLSVVGSPLSRAQREEKWRRVSEMLGVRTMLGPPDEIFKAQPTWSNNRVGWAYWWD